MSPILVELENVMTVSRMALTDFVIVAVKGTRGYMWMWEYSWVPVILIAMVHG